MSKWIPGLATFGLLCLMVLPAPGIWGLLIGVVCAVTILVAGFLWFLDWAADHLIIAGARIRRRRRAVHAGSGIAKKAVSRRKASPHQREEAGSLPLPQAKPSIIQERAQARSLRRDVGEAEPFRRR